MPIFRDPRCVFVGSRAGIAETVAAALCDEGIPAEVMDTMTRGGFEGLTQRLPGGISNRGLEVWVVHAEDADRARAIIAERESQELARAARTGPVAFDCEECGKQIVLPATLEGTVQECPHCMAYVDVPDPKEFESADDNYGEPEVE